MLIQTYFKTKIEKVVKQGKQRQNGFFTLVYFFF